MSLSNAMCKGTYVFEYSTVLYHNESVNVVLEGVSNTYSIPLTVGPNMATAPADAGFMCDKVTVLRKIIKHIHPAGSIEGMYMNFTNLK